MSDTWRDPGDKAAASLVGLLTDEGRKPPRVLARKIIDHLDALGFIAGTDDEDDEIEPDGYLVLAGKRPEPVTWLRFAETLDDDQIPPIAVTRNRTTAALELLGLDPAEVRALVVEHDYLRVYRWSDRTPHSAQTLPVLEELA